MRKARGSAGARPPRRPGAIGRSGTGGATRAVVAIAFSAAVWLSGCRGGPPEGSSADAASASFRLRVAAVEDSDPYRAGRRAAEDLRDLLADVPPELLLVAESFEGKEQKEKVLEGIRSLYPASLIHGAAAYGSFAQERAHELDSVTLLGLGGSALHVATAFEPDLGIAGLDLETDEAEIRGRLQAAGRRLAQALPNDDDRRLLIVIADAHSPKNRFLVEGLQEVLGKGFPITGGSVNKNAGQSFVYSEGRAWSDAAVAILLSGDFEVSLAGRQARDNDAVISTAREAAREALEGAGDPPLGVLAFDCAGRMGKLDDIQSEVKALREVLGPDVPLFGCYCAGEVGPADQGDPRPGVLSQGVGWHVMVTAFHEPRSSGEGG